MHVIAFWPEDSAECGRTLWWGGLWADSGMGTESGPVLFVATESEKLYLILGLWAALGLGAALGVGVPSGQGAALGVGAATG